MVKAYYSRLVPYGLLSEIDDSIGFDAHPVEAPAEAVLFCESLRKIKEEMEKVHDNNPAYEESAQLEADILAEKLSSLLKQHG